ncbi:hypothetical protein CERZMDRAFT_47898 [Cercospora zeae-maydis SCOH1-5]|uniref:Mitochondrial carrier protein n=1 Tax=Cercospora zeae-maydis SCOH1-5 TaxID=717836 RepID=A0A6A6F8F1_9PEZI|nr:hypothetical protein CERZMDRAFT_47898 [Cercospora zeae-maydis SCOH1-5]
MSSQSDGGQYTRSALVQRSPYPRLAIWSTRLSNASINSFSGAMAGMASGIVTCPLDVIKTKLQAQGSFLNPNLESKGPPARAVYRGMIGTAKAIIRQDGVKGMYRGLGPMLLGYLPTWAVYMAVYDSSREYFYAHGYGDSNKDKWFARVYASVTAGACSTVTTNPIWVIKTRLMSQVSRTASDGNRTPWHYSSTLDAARQMYRSEGLAAFYSGLAPALLGLTHVAIQFPLYEYFKQQFTGVEMGATPSFASDTQNTFGILAATFLSKVCATSATYPHESISSSRRIANTDGVPYQPRYRGVLDTFRIILKEEGWRAFYNGMGTNMIRAVPAAMTTMLTFESLKAALGKLREEGRALQEERS